MYYYNYYYTNTWDYVTRIELLSSYVNNFAISMAVDGNILLVEYVATIYYNGYYGIDTDDYNDYNDIAIREYSVSGVSDDDDYDTISYDDCYSCDATKTFTAIIGGVIGGACGLVTVFFLISYVFARKGANNNTDNVIQPTTQVSNSPGTKTMEMGTVPQTMQSTPYYGGTPSYGVGGVGPSYSTSAQLTPYSVPFQGINLGTYPQAQSVSYANVGNAAMMVSPNMSTVPYGINGGDMSTAPAYSNAPSYMPTANVSVASSIVPSTSIQNEARYYYGEYGPPPGSTVRELAPNGQYVNIVIPSNAVRGSYITYHY